MHVPPSLPGSIINVLYFFMFPTCQMMTRECRKLTAVFHHVDSKINFIIFFIPSLSTGVGGDDFSKWMFRSHISFIYDSHHHLSSFQQPAFDFISFTGLPGNDRRG